MVVVRSVRSLARVVALVAVAAAPVLVPLPASAVSTDNQDDLNKQITQSQANLQEASATSLAIAAQLTAAQTALPLAEAAVNQTAAALQAAKDAAAQAQAASVAALAEQQRVQAQVADVTAKLAGTRTAVGLIARRLYQSGGVESQWATILKAESPSDLTGRIAAVRTVGRTTGAAITRLGEEQTRLTGLKLAADAAAQQAETERLKAEQQVALTAQLARDAANAKARVARLVADKNAALAAAQADQAAEQARLVKLQAEQRRVQEELARLAAIGGPGVSGELLWPADGEVSEGVGPRIHPVYGYPSCHTGIDIDAGFGAPIKAAADGTVVLTDVSPAYGNFTLIAHGGGLATMYAHQSLINVKAGQQVTRGQIIGLVGATGFATGPHLHFEVHVNGVPYNPLGWFGGLKSPVVC